AVAAAPRGGGGRRGHTSGLLPLLAERPPNAVAELRGGFLVVDGPRQRRHALFELHQLLAARCATAEVPPDLEVFGPLERAEEVFGQEVADLVTRQIGR